MGGREEMGREESGKELLGGEREKRGMEEDLPLRNPVVR